MKVMIARPNVNDLKTNNAGQSKKKKAHYTGQISSNGDIKLKFVRRFSANTQQLRLFMEELNYHVMAT